MTAVEEAALDVVVSGQDVCSSDERLHRYLAFETMVLKMMMMMVMMVMSTTNVHVVLYQRERLFCGSSTSWVKHSPCIVHHRPVRQATAKNAMKRNLGLDLAT
jgi:hypothetical protein